MYFPLLIHCWVELWWQTEWHLNQILFFWSMFGLLIYLFIVPFSADYFSHHLWVWCLKDNFINEETYIKRESDLKISDLTETHYEDVWSTLDQLCKPEDENTSQSDWKFASRANLPLYWYTAVGDVLCHSSKYQSTCATIYEIEASKITFHEWL